MARSGPKATLGASRFQVAKKGATAFHKFRMLGATWAILGAIWASAGRQGGPKIKHFGTRKHQKSEKWCPGRGVVKKLENLMEF